MKIISKFAAIALMAVAAVTASAQTQLKVATGGPTGTYSVMFKQFQQTCKDEIMQVEIPTTGSVQNMDKILGNEVNAAIVQTDVLFMRARSEDLSGIKTLFSLYPEEVHVYAPTVSKVMDKGNMVGMGKKPIPFNTVADLQGYSIAAWGGSIVTAQLIRIQGEMQYNIVEVNNFNEAKAKLDAGEVQGVLMVGGQPMADLTKLNNSYKLLPFPESLTQKLKAVYTPAKLNYSNLGQGGSGIPTIATDALYVTRAYKTAKYVESLSALRSCFAANLDYLKEETGMHKKWSSVNGDNRGKWAYYELPTAQAKPAEALGLKKK